jgi:hypothetical protein
LFCEETPAIAGNQGILRAGSLGIRLFFSRKGADAYGALEYALCSAANRLAVHAGSGAAIRRSDPMELRSQSAAAMLSTAIVMDNEKTWGWELATNSALLRKVFGCYPSFHDSAVASFSLSRKRKSAEGLDGKPLLRGTERYVVDLRLEILHDRYGPPHADGDPDCIVVVDLLDIRTSDIDVNAMLEEATIMEIRIKSAADNLVSFDLMPGVGLDIRLTCKEIAISEIKPYRRDDF